jgi:hypothetical protein
MGTSFSNVSANFGVAISRINNCGRRSFETYCITLTLSSLSGMNSWLEPYSEADESISHLSSRFFLRSILILLSYVPSVFQLIYFFQDFRTKSCAHVCSVPCMLNSPPSLPIYESANELHVSAERQQHCPSGDRTVTGCLPSKHNARGKSLNFAVECLPTRFCILEASIQISVRLPVLKLFVIVFTLSTRMPQWNHGRFLPDLF